MNKAEKDEQDTGERKGRVLSHTHRVQKLSGDKEGPRREGTIMNPDR